MKETIIGISTFGLLEFTKLAVKSVEETVKSPYKIFLVIGKADDLETIAWAKEKGIDFSYHNYNKGFPVAVNDIYDYAWVNNDYDYLIIMGNDVLPYPYAIDSMIKVADTTDNEWVCASQYDVRSLCRDYPDAKKYFSGEDYIFNFQGEPWNYPKNFTDEIVIEKPGMSDIQNLCLYKKSVFDKIGYTDANFYPAYYIDNDYARRGVNAKIISCTLPKSVYFHFWSRTLKQGKGGSTNRFFENNRKYYITKWGGDFGSEKNLIPFNGQPFSMAGIELEPSLKISKRDNESQIVSYWSSLR